MTTLNRLFTLIRGQARASADAVIDANALALLDQQLHETEAALAQARRDLAALMAERALAEKRLVTAQQDRERYEGYALRALEENQEALAEDTAGRVAELEQQAESQRQQVALLRQRELEFRQFMAEASQTLKGLRQQQAIVRVSERMHHSSRLMHRQGHDLQSRLEQSHDTLARIQSRQEQARAQWQAQQELLAETGMGPGVPALDQRLEQAGILHGKTRRQQEILARLRARQQGQAIDTGHLQSGDQYTGDERPGEQNNNGN